MGGFVSQCEAWQKQVEFIDKRFVPYHTARKYLPGAGGHHAGVHHSLWVADVSS